MSHRAVAPHGPPVETPWAAPAQDVARRLDVDPTTGLAEGEVVRRRRAWGSNELRSHRPRSAWRVLVDQVANTITGLLAAAFVVAAAFREVEEAGAIAVVIVLNAAIGYFTELPAVRAMESLRRLGRVLARVRREGRELDLHAEELVPGDVLILEAGAVLPADVRLVDAAQLQVDESALTGESVPVAKQAAPVAPESPVAERSCMAFRGTGVTRGAAIGLVTATGELTEIGRVARLAAAAESERTPLEKRLARLARRLIWITLAIGGLVATSGLLGGRDTLLVVQTAIALAVAAIPEGLPVVATIALARGTWRMARRNAVVRRLAAVETLGSTTVILTDKTGTLTENRMTLTSLALPGGDLSLERGGTLTPAAEEALRAGVLCNDASWGPRPEDRYGDPLELALLEAGDRHGMDPAALAAAHPRVVEHAFDAGLRLMGSVNRDDGALVLFVKGGPEAVLAASARVRDGASTRPLDDAERSRWLARADTMAAAGLRTIALATRDVPAAEVAPYEGLTFLGIAGLLDPPREDVRSALEACHRAGLSVVVVTGDHPETARAVAERVGLLEEGAPADGAVLHAADLPAPGASPSEEDRRRLARARVLARVSPEQKLDVVRSVQAAGHVVAMTGDGVNDAPALKQADIGVAMGRRGTDVAREAADMVLRDDAFATIVEAIREGRAIFENIRRFVFYLLSCNVSEVLIVGVATVLGAPLPLLPLQILFLNLVTDVFPALALAAGEAEDGTMRRPPRPPTEAILERRHWVGIVLYGSLLTVSVLGAFALALGPLDLGPRQAVTVSFVTLAFGQLWHVLNMGGFVLRRGRTGVTDNPWIWAALAGCAAVVTAAVHVPALSVPLGTADPGPRAWLVAVGASLVPLLVGQLVTGLTSTRQFTSASKSA